MMSQLFDEWASRDLGRASATQTVSKFRGGLDSTPTAFTSGETNQAPVTIWREPSTFGQLGALSPVRLEEGIESEPMENQMLKLLNECVHYNEAALQMIARDAD